MERIIRTTCARHCGDGCGLLVHRRADGSVRISGDPEHPATQGRVCAKTVRFHAERILSPERITAPLVRTRAGKLSPASWDEALGLVAERLQALRSTPERILHVWYYHSFGVLAQASKYLFGQLGAGVFTGSPCLGAGAAAMRAVLGTSREPAPGDVDNAARIVNWGRNLRVQCLHLAQAVRAARARGVPVLAIHPGDAESAGLADRVIRIRPGADRFLAAAVVKLLLGRGLALPGNAEAGGYWRALDSWSMAELLAAADVRLADAETVADWYAAGPTATLLGRGGQRYLRGGENVAHVAALVLLAGQLGRPGGGLYYSQPDLGPAGGGLDFSWTKSDRSPARKLSFAHMARELGVRGTEGQGGIDFVWVEGLNLVTMGMDSRALQQALASRFTVVVEAFPTDTALAATVVLPPALMLETEDVLRFSNHEYLHHAPQALEPRGQARSNFDIAMGVAARLDPPVVFLSKEEVLRGAVPDGQLEMLRRQGRILGPSAGRPFADGRSAHEDGRFQLPATLTAEPPVDPQWPLRLCSFIRKDQLLSQMPATAQQGPAEVRVAPETAATLGLADGDRAVLSTSLGQRRVVVRLHPGLHPEAVVHPRGDWLAHGRGINALIGQLEADMGGQAAYYGQWCRLVAEEASEKFADAPD